MGDWTYVLVASEFAGVQAMKLLIEPRFRNADKGDGGIRRVVEAQRRWLPDLGVEIVETEAEADIVSVHAGLWVETQKPVIAHCHGLYWEGYEWQKWAHLVNADVIETMRRADVVTAPSRWVARALQRGMWLDTPVLYHGIDPEEWADEPSKRLPYVLWNKTRVDPVCDPEPLNVLAKRVPQVNFVTTYGEDRTNVQVTGTVPHDQAKQFVRNAGVYLATSRETFGIGTLEAMAAGVPILGWNWGGQAEFVKHREHGYLARTGDYDDLEQGLQYCIDNARELGAAGREFVLENFTWANVMKSYVEVYENALARRSSGRPKVSVVIPAYNLDNYLRGAVESVITNQMQDIEVVIVDDASTDGTPALADALAASDSRIRVIHNDTNRYLAEALNVGITNARGTYIVPLDADNRLEKGALQILSDALDRDRSIDIAYGSMQVLEPDGREWVSPWPPKEFDFRAQMRHRNQISSTSMYRRRVWERVGGYRARCRTAEDADFWCRATSFGARAAKVTDAVTFTYTNREDSMSHREADWAWHEWYPWGKDQTLTPFGAAYSPRENFRPRIPTHEFPLVSVIIPVGPKHGRLVLDALDSLQAQTFLHWEAIVINDSGRPFEWIHPWATVIETPGEVGPSYARNLGMTKSKAPYLLFLDADDYLQPNALEAMYAVVNSDPDRKTFAYSDWYNQATGERNDAPEYDCGDVLRRLPFAVTCMYPAEVFARTGGFDTAFTSGWEDWDFAIAVAAEGFCGQRVPLPLFHYRYDSGTRREAAFAERESLKETVRTKWAEYFTGKKELMACKGCGGRRTTNPTSLRVTSPATASAPANAPEEGLVLLEFAPDDPQGTRTYTGRVTGRKYRFGSDPDHRVRYVDAKDAPHLISLGSFKRYSEPVVTEMTPLKADGPPKRA